MRKLMLGLIGFAMVLQSGSLRAHGATWPDSQDGVLVLAQARKDSGEAGGGPVELSYSTILGKWCGLTTNYVFTRTELTVTWPDGNRRVLEIARYEFNKDFVNVFFKPSGNTIFGEFDSDGNMAQQPNTRGDMGPRRPFKRC